MFHGADLLLHSLLVYGIVVVCGDSCTYLVEEYLKNGDLVADALEVCRDAQKFAEGISLFPCDVVFAESWSRQALSNCFMSRIVCSQGGTPDGEKDRLQGVSCGKVEREFVERRAGKGELAFMWHLLLPIILLECRRWTCGFTLGAWFVLICIEGVQPWWWCWLCVAGTKFLYICCQLLFRCDQGVLCGGRGGVEVGYACYKLQVVYC